MSAAPCQGWGRGFEALRPLQIISIKPRRSKQSSGSFSAYKTRGSWRFERTLWNRLDIGGQGGAVSAGTPAVPRSPLGMRSCSARHPSWHRRARRYRRRHAAASGPAAIGPCHATLWDSSSEHRYDAGAATHQRLPAQRPYRRSIQGRCDWLTASQVSLPRRAGS